MPTPYNFNGGSKNPLSTELKVAAKKSTLKPYLTTETKTAKNTALKLSAVSKFRKTPVSRLQEHVQLPPKSGENRITHSTVTLAIQNLEFPEMPTTRLKRQPTFFVKCGKVPMNDSCSSTEVGKVRGYDFTSSTNSHYDGGWLLDVPRQFKQKCSTTTTDNASSSSLKTSLPKKPLLMDDRTAEIVTSKEMTDSEHKGSRKRLNFKGPEWQKPCKESFVAGAPNPYVGTCLPNYEELSKMSKIRQKFFLTQDPRKRYCLRNPAVLRTKAYSKLKEFDSLTKMVKHADNICAATASQSTDSFVCEVIDLENPMQLDFHGLDYRKTYEKDEQDLQNQHVYRRICRCVEHRRVRAQVKKEVADNAELCDVPECFAIRDHNDYSKSTSSVSTVHEGKLFRSADKPHNYNRIMEERERRHGRYKENYTRKKYKREEKLRKIEEAKKVHGVNLASILALQKFNSAVQNINEAIKRSFQKERQLRHKEIQRRMFPHTMRETWHFKKAMKQQNRIKRDEARVKQEFYRERLGKEKSYPETKLEISSDTVKHTESTKLSEQSSDDEDAMEVGKDGAVFKLRGFQYKLDKNLRGKRHNSERAEDGGRTPKGCITREQWLHELAPQKEAVILDVEMGIVKRQHPDDPNLRIFQPEFNFKPPQVEVSAVRTYRRKRLGRHYVYALHKRLKLAKPRPHYKVKKFNLISFRYGERKMDTQAHDNDKAKALEIGTTLEYTEAKHLFRKQQQQLIKQQRLRLLGIPCKVEKKSRLQTKCEHSDTESGSDWVPKQEPDFTGSAKENAEIMRLKSVHIPRRLRGNMPAPKYRETTLRRHPRHPRDYLGERVPSELFDQAVKTKGIPILHKLSNEVIQYADLSIKKGKHTSLFQARHHHDHWNPTQKQFANVCYQAAVVKPKVTIVKHKKDEIPAEKFRVAKPPCSAFVDMDISMPKYDMDQMIVEYEEQHPKRLSDPDAKIRVKDECKSGQDFVYHSRRAESREVLDYPGRKEYMQLLYEIRDAIHENQDTEAGQEKLLVDKDTIITELEEDLKSIESCLTSMSSSGCTNLTNDSGSFLLMEGKTKLPLDYIRKSLVPFEEIQRSRFKVKPIDVEAEEANPFRYMPFCGQSKLQKNVYNAQETFFTFNTRIQNGLRLRLEVPVEDVRQKLIGRRGQTKYPSAVVTDIDEDFINELKNIPPNPNFKFKSNRSFIKDALRLKFESLLIQGQIVRTKIYDRLNEDHWENMQAMKMLYENLFAKWQKQEYETSMAVVHQVKSYYDTSDMFRGEFRLLKRQMILLNMDIVFIESHWVRRIMYQNFHYLLGDQDWRIENDWIHRKDGDIMELEDYQESIQKRSIVNIRQRDKDDAVAIKKFYEETYLPNKQPLLIFYPDGESFIEGIETLKKLTFIILLELHFTMYIHSQLQSRLETFEDWCTKELEEKEQYVERKCAKKYFMEDRAAEIKRRCLDYLDEPIEESFNNATFNRDHAVINEVYRCIVPVNIRGAIGDQELEPVDKVALIAERVMEVLGKFETINYVKSRKVEAFLRKKRIHDRKSSAEAVRVEARIKAQFEKLSKSLWPVAKKPMPKPVKLPRSFVKMRKIVEQVPQKRVTEHTRFFFRAFHEDDEVVTGARRSMLDLDLIQDEVTPFFFDHFLKVNGYTPNYNFKTQVEIRDGSEWDRIKVPEALPEIAEKLANWEKHRKLMMEKFIKHNPRMYENVNV